MKDFIFKTLASLCLLGVEKEVEITPSAVTNESANTAEVTIDYRFTKKHLVSYYSFNPRLKVSTPWMFSGGLGVGVRKDLVTGFGGVHLFGDYSYLYGSHHFQFGPSLEYIHPKWDVTLNYYAPITGKAFSDDFFVKAIHHVDGSVFYKSRYMHFGLEPSYSVDANKFGLVSHLSIPTTIGDFSLSGGKDQLHGKHAKVGVSLPIYRSGSSKGSFKVRRGTGVIHQVQDIKRPQDPPKSALPLGVEPEKQCSWWDFFFRVAPISER